MWVIEFLEKQTNLYRLESEGETQNKTLFKILKKNFLTISDSVLRLQLPQFNLKGTEHSSSSDSLEVPTSTRVT